MINDLTTDEEQVIQKVRFVKSFGYGKVIVQIQNGKATYTNCDIGEQIKMELGKNGQKEPSEVSD